MKKALLLTTLLLVLPGCGGADRSQDPQAFGRATFRIAWPESSRLIPQASTSIEIKVLNGDKVVATRVLARPATGVAQASVRPRDPGQDRGLDLHAASGKRDEAGSPGFHYSFADEAEGQGAFIANGTLTFED